MWAIRIQVENTRRVLLPWRFSSRQNARDAIDGMWWECHHAEAVKVTSNKEN